MVVLGEASYSIYLLHPWVLHVFLAPGPQKVSDLVACEWAVRMVMSVGFCLCISLGTYAAIEVPGRRWLRGALGWAAGVRAPSAGWRRPVFAVAVYAVPCAGIAAGMYLFRTTTAPAQLLATGNQLAGAGRTDDAVRCYDRALELNPRMSAALFQRAMLRVNGQDRGQAVADFNRILDIDPRGAFAAYAIIYRGYARLSDTDYPAAEADLTAGLARSPGNGLAYFWRGVARQHLGRLPDAEADFAKAVEHDPKLFQACYQLGEVRRSLGDLPGAEAAFAAGTKANPHWAACFYERGILSARAGRTDEARADFDTVIRLDPAFIPARTARAALGPSRDDRTH